MSLPWLFNQWACNAFTGEPERNAAVDTARLGGVATPSLADVLTPPPLAKDPADYSTEDWFNTLTADWPTVDNVIPSDKHIYWTHTEDVRTFVNRYKTEGEEPRTKLQCYDYVDYQLHVMDFRPSGPFAEDRDTIMVLYEYEIPGDRTRLRTELQVLPTIKAVKYLKEALQDGTPIVIGMRLNAWPLSWPLREGPRPNERRSTPFIEPTNHFVVAVGMGEDENGKYVSFFDYHHDQEEGDRLYLKPSLFMESSNNQRTLTEVRLSTAR